MEDIVNTQGATMPSRVGSMEAKGGIKMPWQGTFIAVIGIVGAVISGFFTAIILLLSAFVEKFLDMLSENVNEQIKGSAQNIEVSGYSVKDLPRDLIDVVGTFNGVDFASKIPDDFSSYMFFAKIFAIGFLIFQIAMVIGFFNGKKLAVLISFLWLMANAIMLFMIREALFSKMMIVMIIIYAFFAYLHIACLKNKFYKKFI